MNKLQERLDPREPFQPNSLPGVDQLQQQATRSGS